MKPFAASFAAVLTTAFVLSACAGAGRPSPAPVFVLADSGYLSPEALARLAEAAPPAPLPPQRTSNSPTRTLSSSSSPLSMCSSWRCASSREACQDALIFTTSSGFS